MVKVLVASVMPIVIGMFLSFAIEHLVEPHPKAFWRRPRAALAIHLGIWISIYSCAVLLLRRPWFAMCAVLTIQLIVVLVSDAKLHSLREPFVFQDFEYFVDTMKHPRLFLPFLGIWRGLLLVAVFCMVFFTGMVLEPSLALGISFLHFVVGGFTLMFAGAVILRLGGLERPEVTFNPDADIRSFGFWASLWCYAMAERSCPVVSTPFAELKPTGMAIEQMPNLVVVQSESFFDPRRIYPMIRPEVLQTFDRLRASAGAYGKLTVPAWGANTVRTEFSFLSGIDNEILGVHRFNPYRKVTECSFLSLIGFVKGLGYRTVCVHPYPESYYGRSSVYPHLGFDEFIDIRSFVGSERFGAYVSDTAVAEKVCSLVEASAASAQPVFVFVITMENHGPLHLEKVPTEEAACLYKELPPPMCDDLAVYLRHLGNADRMAEIISTRLLSLHRPSSLCWYGDHVPIMAKVYSALGEPDGTSDYLIWQTPGRQAGNTRPAIRQDLPVQDLALALLNIAGLVATDVPLLQTTLTH